LGVVDEQRGAGFAWSGADRGDACRSGHGDGQGHRLHAAECAPCTHRTATRNLLTAAGTQLSVVSGWRAESAGVYTGTDIECVRSAVGSGSGEVAGVTTRGVRALPSALATLAVLAGAPVALVWWAGWPLPRHWPRGRQWVDWLSQPVTVAEI